MTFSYHLISQHPPLFLLKKEEMGCPESNQSVVQDLVKEFVITLGALIGPRK